MLATRPELLCRSRSPSTSLTSLDFWISVGILAGIYALFALGLQLNVGFTGIVNFGQAGFMAIGAYSMAILTVDSGLLVLARPAARDRWSRSASA